MQQYQAKDRSKVESVLSQLAPALTGQKSGVGSGQAIDDLFLRLGEEAQTIFHEAFLRKSKGDVDAAGIFWPPLKRETVAYSRDHTGLTRKRVGERPRGMLTDKQDARWRQLFAWTYRALVAKGDNDDDAKGHAAAYAWRVLKAEGAKTILGTYGDQSVDILVKTGALEESMRPGGGSSYQIVRRLPNGVIVGTSHPAAAAHQHGTKHMPARKLYPEGELPDQWRARLDALIAQGIGELLTAMLREEAA